MDPSSPSEFSGMTWIPDALVPYMPLVVGTALALLIFVIGWVASKWGYRLALQLMHRRKIDESLARFLSSLVQYLILAAAVITALAKVGLETTSLVALLGSAGIAVGLALQGNLAHFASGVMVLLFRPLTIGDYVTLDGHEGFVEDIGLFATTIRTLDNDVIILGNGAVTGGAIINHSKLGKRRGRIAVGVAYGTKIEDVMPVLERAARKSSRVLKEPAPYIAFVELGASSLDFQVMPWCKPEDYIPMLHEVRVAVYEELNAAGIEIPFSQIVVHNASAQE
ncbi:mechanosensitive ion channel family protein [Paraliomyxa miuraensis]|uniref:mechanosensitive ion channel family protein n=1 Tax=Paraliomyxa miuraensis TaxID=376150 RepID=UPI002256F83A|nr:mechanosensitive ion channel domain-containing protein [Paraliomyxa miuraensis]MCX4247841.1 mechanosensitive ion channel [Paraliomyxa miuraensis]